MAGSLLTSVRGHLHPTDDTHRVTALELLFDLVFVYAITNVTSLMEHDVGPRGVLEGLIVLGVVWFGWSAFAWLGNQAKADEGLLRLAMIVAMAGMFFVAISIPHAFGDEGNAAVVLALAYALVRLVHLGVYLVAAGQDTQLRSVLLGMCGTTAVALSVLVAGAFMGSHERVWWWLAAVLLDQVGVYFVRSTRWRLNSASHFAERFGLIIIIAIGESVVDLGTASSNAELTLARGAALVCGLAIAVCLWWLYFDVVAAVAEGVLHRATGVTRARLARDSYTYLHIPLVAGIVFTAMGLALLVSHDHIDAGRYALYGGLVLYLTGHLLFRIRNIGSVNYARLVTTVVLAVGIVAMGRTEALVQLAFPAVVMVVLVSFEVTSMREWRARVRHGEDAAMGESIT